MLHGGELAEPIPRPSFTLTATDGQPFDFAERTKGKLTFVFFGFTNCPDICPVHMANLAAALKTLSYEDRQKIAVVFISVDPERDSLPAIRSWLDNFDQSFVGLSGSLDDVNRILTDLRMPPAVQMPADEKGDYSVGHSARMLVFDAKTDVAYVSYGFGTRQKDWTDDLPRLLKDGGKP